MIYVSERIVNISELESLIQDARINFEMLTDEIKKDVPSIARINATSKVVKDSLQRAEKFDFHIEKGNAVLKILTRIKNCRKIFQESAIWVKAIQVFIFFTLVIFMQFGIFYYWACGIRKLDLIFIFRISSKTIFC